VLGGWSERETPSRFEVAAPGLRFALAPACHHSPLTTHNLQPQRASEPMRDDIAGPIYTVLRQGLDLRERLERNPELLDVGAEQTTLKEALRKVPNLGEEKVSRDQHFLGIRYPLVCWLDEIFILNSPWKTEWTESSMEMALYDSRERAWQFWEQAQLAESRAGGDAVEVFFLCVMLGFRGDWRNKPDKLQDWQRTVKALVLDPRQRRWPMPDEVQPPTYVPPLTGRRRKQSMLLTGAISLLVLIPVAVFYVVHSLLQR
jgi:type VI secretion system protein ImpK